MARPVDRQNIDRLVQDLLPETLRFATRLTGSPEAGEEVMQEALCRVLGKWQSYRGEATFRTWMFQIVLNVARQQHRDVRPVGELDFEPVGREPPPLANLEANELSGRIRAAIDQLPARQREVAILKFGEERTAKEIADILEITEANVHSCVNLVRRRIARAIGVDHVPSNAPTRLAT